MLHPRFDTQKRWLPARFNVVRTVAAPRRSVRTRWPAKATLAPLRHRTERDRAVKRNVVRRPACTRLGRDATAMAARPARPPLARVHGSVRATSARPPSANSNDAP